MTAAPPDVFQMARDTYTVPELWVMLRLPGDPKPSGNQRSPFRDERHPSFSIFDNGKAWKDQGTGDGGDVVEFVKHALGGEYSDVREWFAERLGLDLLDGQQSARMAKAPAAKASQPPKVIEWPGELHEGKPETWKAFADLRGLQYRTVHVAVHAGLLRFLKVDGAKCWAVLDPSNKSAEIRRWDGELFGRSKAYPLRGVDKSWPVGLYYMQDAPKDAGILIAEGASDFLSALDLYVTFRKDGGQERWMPAALLGASCKQLHPEAQRIIKGRRVRLVPDADPAGRAMTGHWKPMLLGMQCVVDVVELPEGSDLREVAGQIEPETLFKLQ